MEKDCCVKKFETIEGVVQGKEKCLIRDSDGDGPRGQVQLWLTWRAGVFVGSDVLWGGRRGDFKRRRGKVGGAQNGETIGLTGAQWKKSPSASSCCGVLNTRNGV